MFKHAPWSSGTDDKKGDDDESLTTILETSEERGQLTLLVATCTATMRKAICDIFELPGGEDKVEHTELTGDDAIQNPNIDIANVDVEAMDGEGRERERREKELRTPEMKELRTAALKFFDDWRDNVLQRVGEVVNSRETAEAQKSEARPQSPKLSSRKVTSEKQDESVTTTLHELYPPTPTALWHLEEEKRKLILHSMLLLLLSLEHYAAHSRILLLHLTSSLDLSIDVLSSDEAKIARGLLEAAKNMSADEETKKAAEENATGRKWKVGLASVAGAAIIGVTGGLAAPLLAAGLGSVMGGLGLGATAAAGYLGTVASSTVIVGSLFGAYGARMTGQMMDQYAKEVDDFAFVPVHSPSKPRRIEKEYTRLRVAIGISGWLAEPEDVVKPWKVIGNSVEAFALRYELGALMNLGNSLTTMVKSYAWGYAKSELIKRTVFASLSAALWPLGLLKVSRIIDNPFSVARARSEKAGEVLADALINRVQGERPVTLIGYSLGARLIYTCLLKLAERKVFGLVESVVLLGAPTPSTAAEWRKIRAVVSGRVVNVYSTNDYILGFLYRTSSIQFGIAGLQAISDVQGVQNVDVSEMVSGHTRYRYLTGSILKKIGFEDIDVEEVTKEEERLRQAEREEEEEQLEKEEKQKGRGEEEEAKDMEKEIKEKNEQGWSSYLSGAASMLSISGGSKARSAGNDIDNSLVNQRLDEKSEQVKTGKAHND